MLTPLFFSNLLTYQEFAPAILRFAAACTFFYLAYWHFKRKKEVAQELSVLSHEVAVWIVGLYLLIEVAIGIALFIGFWTQLAAIVGAIICLKNLLLKRSMHNLVPFPKLTYVLLGALCLSVVLTGAGIFFAIDLPL
jgi:uncharacterized membrane protein YphA (DoxX/SURF4 family)